MKRTTSLVMLASIAGAVYADSGLKPGLWEMHVTKNAVDGRDQSAQLAGASTRMQEAMARMTPEQRAQMGAMMQHSGVSLAENGGIRMCITPEMARRDVPVVDKDGACKPTNLQRSGNHMSYEITCTKGGTKMTGTGESTISGDSVSTRSNMTMSTNGQTHQMQTETEMKFVSSNCGDVKPVSAPKAD